MKKTILYLISSVLFIMQNAFLNRDNLVLRKTTNLEPVFYSQQEFQSIGLLEAKKQLNSLNKLIFNNLFVDELPNMLFELGGSFYLTPILSLSLEEKERVDENEFNFIPSTVNIKIDTLRNITRNLQFTPGFITILGIYLNNQSFVQSRFSNNYFKSIQFYESDFTRSLWLGNTLINNNFNQAEFENSKWKNNSLNSGTLNQASFRKSIIQQFTLTGSEAHLVNFERSQIANAVINSSDLTSCNFNDSQLVNVTFQKTNLQKCTFKNVRFKNVKFEKTDLTDIDLTGATGTVTSYDDIYDDIFKKTNINNEFDKN